MTFKFEVGKKYTTVDISDFMACSVKREIVIKDEDSRGTIFSLKGKRKKFYTRVNKSTAIFEGHDIDLKIDSEFVITDSNGFTSRQYTGNALLNFIGTIDFVKDWIENKNLNEELDKSLITASTHPTRDEETFMVYPEHENIKNHAVARRLVEKQLLTN